MVLSLGGFSFNASQIDNVAIETDFGFSTQERVRNFHSVFSASRGGQTISIIGKTLPYAGDKQTRLEKLYKIAKRRLPEPLTNGNGRYLGRFVIEKIGENRSNFTQSGSFVSQSFSIELRRVY